jgi:hypothetical protein
MIAFQNSIACIFEFSRFNSGPINSINDIDFIPFLCVLTLQINLLHRCTFLHFAPVAPNAGNYFLPIIRYRQLIGRCFLFFVFV